MTINRYLSNEFIKAAKTMKLLGIKYGFNSDLSPTYRPSFRLNSQTLIHFDPCGDSFKVYNFVTDTFYMLHYNKLKDLYKNEYQAV